MSEVKERPILFSGEMVRAILANRKTQTRRVIKPREIERMEYKERLTWTFHIPKFVKRCPYGKVGDLLWVRETWRKGMTDGGLAVEYAADGHRTYLDDYPDKSTDWYWLDDMPRRPSIFMPRWASRITLEIVSVKVERVQAITDDDAVEEGVDRTNTSIPTYARQRYQKLWDSINGKRAGCAWADNPFCWCIEFRRVSE